MATIFKNPWAKNQWASEEEQAKTLEQEWAEVDKGEGKANHKSSEDPYEKAIKNNKYRYTCRAGWIDKSHFNTPSTRPYVGAKSLWDQIVDEKGQISDSEPSGFCVTYRQDAKVISFLNPIGIEKSYWVKKGLSVSEKEEIALAIFQEVSMAFEGLQGAAVWSGSSFEPADLISNLLGFYYTVRGYFDYNIFEICGMLTIEQSLEIYKQYPGTFTDKKYKNKKWTPRYFPNKYCPKNPTFPKEFQEIVPAKKGINFRDWSFTDIDADYYENYNEYSLPK